ncbi:MAG: hypothetical protein U0931_29265 [Vulcanimicrobiota bacterium]
MTCQSSQFIQPRVLVVDSDPGVLKMLSLALQRESVSVETAASESAALALCHCQDFQALLFGLGEERVAPLLAEFGESRPAPRILVMANELHPRPCAYPVLSKPFGLAELRRKLGEIIRVAALAG